MMSFVCRKRLLLYYHESAGLLCSVLSSIAKLTPVELEKYMELLSADASPAHMNFDGFWGRCSRCVRIEHGSVCADAGPAKVGAAMSSEACADGGHSWTLRRISNGGGDYLGICTADIRLSAAPTSGSFLPTSSSIVAGFRVTANIGGDLRYKNHGSVLQPWHRNLPTFCVCSLRT